MKEFVFCHNKFRGRDRKEMLKIAIGVEFGHDRDVPCAREEAGSG